METPFFSAKRIIDHETFSLVDKMMPELNDQVAGGYVAREMQGVEAYIESTVLCTTTSFPPGLVYVGSARCGPQETYNLMTAKQGNRQVFETARSDIYLMRYNFEYNGEPIKPVYLYLPFVSRAGITHIRDAQFAISPVLADNAISADTNAIFIPLQRAKLNFYRLVHHYNCNGTREANYLVWTPIYNVPKNKTGRRKKVSAFTSAIHYLFCQYGLTRAFKEIAGASIEVGFHDTINEKTHPPEHWRICQSVGIKPRGVYEGKYQASDIRLAIKHSEWTSMVASLVTGFFYVVDFFPTRVLPEFIDETALWKTLLGKIIFPTEESETKILTKVEDHMRSLSSYIDPVAKKRLADGGVDVVDIYDLFINICETFHDRVTQTSTNVASLYGKNLIVLRYVLSDVVAGWFNMSFAFLRASKKQLTRKDVETIMRDNVRADLITRINRQHGEVSSVSSSTDNMIFKLTSNVVQQTSSSGGTGAKSGKPTVEPSKFAHVSIAEVCSYLNSPKSEPSGRGKLNPCVKIGPGGEILRNKELAELLDKTQKAFDR